MLWFGVSRCRAVLVNIARLKEVTEERNSQREMKERRAQRAVLAERDPPPPPLLAEAAVLNAEPNGVAAAAAQ